MKITNTMFLTAKRGNPGRRLTRHLNNAAVARAKNKSTDITHQMKFMSPMKKFATALALAS